ncbi:Sulfate permease, Trk-type [Pseudoalteromonas luteoviolacea B = ATCC 29581]|nr:Sulfate permease, Trk-type [Pseudoalteromonas luteoviolacea B = ATCC 29581]
MFIVAAGIHASGGIELLVNKVLGTPKTERQALARIFFPVVTLSAFLNNTPVVATLIPALNVWAKKINIPTSKLMLPLSYTAILGGTITLIGTSTNLVVNGQYQMLTGGEGFGLFDITAIGLPVAIAGLLVMYWLAPKWLPHYSEQTAFANLREFTLEVMVKENGALVGQTITAAGLRNLKRIYLIEIERSGTVLSAVSPEETLQSNDRLVFAGETEAIAELLKINGLIAPLELAVDSGLKDKQGSRRLVEAVISPHCEVIGETIRDAHFRNRYGAVVLAAARNGERLTGGLGSITLQAGDTLLLEARPAFVSRQKYSKEFLLINELDHEPLNHDKAKLAWGILISAVSCVTFEWISMLNAALLAAGAMLATGCLTVKQAEHSLDLNVLITIAASFALGTALQNTGVSGFLADNLVNLSAGNALLLLILVYITLSVLTEIITNNAAALLMLPLVLDITTKAGLNPEPFVLAIMMAASASFATPLGYQTNLMVMGPGNYKFSDYLRVGLPMNIFIGAVTLLILGCFWPLYL